MKIKSGNQLRMGDVAPDFKLPDMNDDLINLRDYVGRKVLLSFFRYASCPFCNTTRIFHK